MGENKIATSSFSMDQELIKKFKLWCVENKISMSKKLSQIISDFLDRRGR